MWFSRGGAASKATAAVSSGIFVRYFSRERAVNVRKINPKVPPQEAYSIARGLYDVIKAHGPLTVGNTWTHAQEAGLTGLQSKTHMKIMLKWMRGRKMLKLLCNNVGSNKKFLHTTLPEEPQKDQPVSTMGLNLQTERPPLKKKGKKKSK
ncbi:hypothetical protein CRG98_010117 [Punica granatum]|uniref:Tumor necrosis factor receptor superfamily member 21 n=1 Tax=Punica granatum TaxID=22663 RepID=A0A2I0KLX3_PUNGR|nr:hypothetical protein CRG98_010117 [Punica granatum]